MQNLIYNQLQLTQEMSAHDQVSIFLRQAILRRELLPGERLPTLRELAALWGTNYFTVQRATGSLVAEGLLVKRKRLGIFVAEKLEKLNHVCIYLSNRQHQYDEYAFYNALQEELNNQLLGQGIQATILRDTRPMAEHTEPPSLLLEGIQSGAIQGVIAALMHVPDFKWVRSLAIPVAYIGGDDPVSVSHDNYNMLANAIDHLFECGREKVAIISHYTRLDPKTKQPAYPEGYQLIQDAFKRHGYKLNKKWTRGGSGRYKQMVKFGYDQMKALWKLPQRPDGLVVVPDEVARGVIMAALELGIKVPEELRVVSHRNVETQYFCPLPMDYLNISIKDTAAALIRQLQIQVDGGVPQKITLDAKLDVFK